MMDVMGCDGCDGLLSWRSGIRDLQSRPAANYLSACPGEIELVGDRQRAWRPTNYGRGVPPGTPVKHCPL